MGNAAVPTAYVSGRFDKTMPSIRPAKVALLRLDGDLYDSTKTALENLLPLVTVGAYLMVHDYQYKGVRDAVREIIQDDPSPIYSADGRGTAYWRMGT